jgi:hypothetical protein
VNWANNRFSLCSDCRKKMFKCKTCGGRINKTIRNMGRRPECGKCDHGGRRSRKTMENELGFN